MLYFLYLAPFDKFIWWTTGFSFLRPHQGRAQYFIFDETRGKPGKILPAYEYQWLLFEGCGRHFWLSDQGQGICSQIEFFGHSAWQSGPFQVIISSQRQDFLPIRMRFSTKDEALEFIQETVVRIQASLDPTNMLEDSRDYLEQITDLT